MEEDGCGSSGVLNIHSDIPLRYVVLSLHYWDYLQVVSFDLDYYSSDGVDWSLEKVEDL